ncbi:MAG: 16S rRNA (adenine(1518)-N(6)/adenine(1519)-N(6))-dimethyltransferase RsmA, partial [Thermoguttaceae bacterium]
MSEPSAKQTLSFLRNRFHEVGIRPHQKLGQNFLIDMNLQRVLLETAALGPADVVLEVGTGTGGLTMLIAPQVAAVVTVEVDRDLFHLAGEELFELPNVTMLHADALAGKNHLNAAMLEAVYGQLDAAPGRHFKLLANLPYSIATPLLGNLLALDRPPESMTCTLQKELGDRITARPSTKGYGALAIWVQSQCRPQIVRVLAPTVFWPRPKVSSVFMQIVLAPQLRSRIGDRDGFHDFLRVIFRHRRKFLRSCLLSGWKDRFDKPGVDRLMQHLGLDGTTRAEQLDPDR